MLLAIDAGNTNTVFAVHDGTEFRTQWRSATRDARTADEHFVWLNQLMQLEGLRREDITGAIVATVVPQALFNLRLLCAKYFHVTPLVIGQPGVRLGIGIHIDRPDEVGADRLVNAVAAHLVYRGALIVLDFGTATTFDVVAEDGAYEGGVIAPGINLSLEALHMAAAKLPHIAIGRPAQVIGKDTIPAMKSGIYWGYVGLIEGLVARIREEFGRPMTVVATGGLAPLFAHATPVIAHVEADLTMRGLVEIYRRNAGAADLPHHIEAS
jgi:type III pantothenate kinase